MDFIKKQNENLSVEGSTGEYPQMLLSSLNLTNARKAKHWSPRIVHLLQIIYWSNLTRYRTNIQCVWNWSILLFECLLIAREGLYIIFNGSFCCPTEHVFSISIENAKNLGASLDDELGERDCFVQYRFPEQKRASKGSFLFWYLIHKGTDDTSAMPCWGLILSFFLCFIK